MKKKKIIIIVSVVSVLVIVLAVVAANYNPAPRNTPVGDFAKAMAHTTPINHPTNESQDRLEQYQQNTTDEEILSWAVVKLKELYTKALQTGDPYQVMACVGWAQKATRKEFGDRGWQLFEDNKRWVVKRAGIDM